MFSDRELNDAVNSSLEGVPDGHRHAVVAGVDRDGVKIVASLKLDDKDRWVLQGAAEHDWNGDNKVGAKLILSW